MNADLSLAFDRAVSAVMTHTINVVSALTIGGDWAKVEESTTELVRAEAVLRWEVEKASRDPFYSAHYSDDHIDEILRQMTL